MVTTTTKNVIDGRSSKTTNGYTFLSDVNNIMKTEYPIKNRQFEVVPIITDVIIHKY
jgi:hypothetical protein